MTFTISTRARALFHGLAGGIIMGAVACISLPAAAATEIPLNLHQNLDTFYVTIGVAGAEQEQYLVDTGAGYMTITDSTRDRLEQAGTATYVRELEGKMADGRVLRVPVYRLTEILVGDNCLIRNVEAAVLPGATRGLFGLSALKKTSPFSFSVDPPSLALSNCGEQLVNVNATPTAR